MTWTIRKTAWRNDVAAAAISTALVIPAAWGIEPDEFKELKIGMPYGEVTTNSAFRCAERASLIGDQICNLKPDSRQTIAGKPVASMMLNFYNKRLATIYITVNPDDVAGINIALTDKYGEPTVRQESEFKTRIGAKLANLRTAWLGQVTSLVTRRYSSNTDRGVVQFTDNNNVSEYGSRLEQQRVKNAKDL